MTDRDDDDRYDPLGHKPATPSSAERFGGEMSPILLGKLSDAEIAAFVARIGKWDRAIGAPAGLPEIVRRARGDDTTTD